MNKILIISIILFSMLIAFAVAQQCETDAQCAGLFCTKISHKTYSAACTGSTCIQGTSFSCVIGSCGALCAADTDCSCPYTDTCQGPDKIDYPDYGMCGTAGSEGCLCQINTGTGGDCEATIIPNDPGCMEQNCQEIEIGSACIADGRAEIIYEWNYPACGQGRTLQIEDLECGCTYSSWADEICVGDGLRAQTRLDYTLYDYCNLQYQEIPDPACSCISSESDRSCISDGNAGVVYTYNFDYCNDSYVVNEGDDACLCIYSDWITAGCAGFKQRGFTREELSGYSYCEDPLYQVLKDGTCDTIASNGNIPGTGIKPQNFCPEIMQEQGDCNGQDGGSVCYHVDTAADIPKLCSDDLTCVSNLTNSLLLEGIIGRAYAFEGETVNFTTSVFDKDGIIDDCVHVYVTLDNGDDPIEAGCILLQAENWTDPHTQITYTNALGHYECIYTVEPAEGRTYGEYWLSAKVIDGCGEGCSSQAAGVVSLFLNPVVSLTIESQDRFWFNYDMEGNALDAGNSAGPFAGDTAYTPYFTIENAADARSGLYLLLRLYGTDMWDYSDSASLCPDSNVLTADHMEYRASHLNAQQPWTTMPRGETAKAYVFDNIMANFLGVGDDVTMRLRLNIPTPCTGRFMDGGEIVFVGEVI